MRARSPLCLAVAAAVLVTSLTTGAAARPGAASTPAAVTSAGSPAIALQVTPIPLGGDGLARISPELAGVRVDGAGARQAQERFDLTYAQLQTAIATRVASEGEIASLAEREIDLTATIGSSTAARKVAVAQLATARQTLRELAVGAYILSADHDDLTRTLDASRATEIGSAQVLSEAARSSVAVEVQAATDAVAAADAAIDAARSERDAARARVAVVGTLHDQAAADEIRFTAESGERMFDLEQVRATSVVSGMDFTLVALDAFVHGADSSGSCGMPWWGLAGISRVEGRHGTYGGGALLPDGQVSNPIIGIPLTGAAGTAIVGDTDGGSLDGDAAYDRAVGPMQFIPSTWSRWRADGDLDGDADPQNMYDAVAAAAAYLCYGRVMRTEDDLRAGYFSYNHSQYYVDTVLAYALSYSNFQIPAPPAPGPVAPTYPVQGQ